MSARGVPYFLRIAKSRSWLAVSKALIRSSNEQAVSRCLVAGVPYVVGERNADSMRRHWFRYSLGTQTVPPFHIS
jgi:hypothetical protein